MNTAKLETNLEKEFHVSVLIVAYKLVTGLLELVFGLGILFFGKVFTRIYYSFVAGELLENPHDLLIRFSQRIVPYVLAHNHTLIAFLLLIGLSKIAGAVGLILKKDWGVDLLIGVTLLFLPFQIWNLVMHHSLPDLFYLLIGIFISLYLINFRPAEYSAKIFGKMKKS